MTISLMCSVCFDGKVPLTLVQGTLVCQPCLQKLQKEFKEMATKPPIVTGTVPPNKEPTHLEKIYE